MRPALKTSLLFAAAWVGIKLLFLGIGVFQDEIFVPGLINNLFLLSAISVGLFLEKKKNGYAEGSALDDIKNGMVGGVPYVLIVSIFMFFYYRDIHPQFIQERVTERNDKIYGEMERESYVDSLRLKFPRYEVLTKNEIYREIQADTKSGLAPKSLFIFSLLGMIVLTLTYSIFVTAIYRKILFRELITEKRKNENDPEDLL